MSVDDESCFALPSGLLYLHIQWNIIFPLTGVNGTISNGFCAFIIDKLPTLRVDFGRLGLHEAGGGRWYTLEFSPLATVDDIRALVKIAVAALQKTGTAK